MDIDGYRWILLDGLDGLDGWMDPPFSHTPLFINLDLDDLSIYCSIYIYITYRFIGLVVDESVQSRVVSLEGLNQGPNCAQRGGAFLRRDTCFTRFPSDCFE